MEMDGVEEATTQQMEPSAHAAAAGGDLLSGLCDDVLAHILGLAEYARDAVHTGVLSRRWRGLWRRAPALRFASWQQQGGSAEGFIALVDDTLSSPHGRSSDGGLDQLVIEFDVYDRACRNQQLLLPSIAAAERWIGYAVRHGVKSFHFELSLPDDEDEDDYKDDDDDEVHEENSNEETPVLALNELPSSAKLEAMHLKLGDAWVRLPATVVFSSLTDLTLESIMVAGDNVLLLLGRLVSSACCPSLQKLRMCHITTRPRQQNLLVEAGVLTELVLDGMFGMRSIELRTPNLRVLCIRYCHDLESFAVSVPRLLEEFTCQQNPLLIINQDFPCVSSLKLDLYSHGHANVGDRSNHVNINLLQRCGSVSCLALDLHISTVASFDVDIIKGRIPELGHVRSLKARVGPAMTSSGPHSVGNCVASLLTLFNNLMCLHLYFGYRNKDI
ncbi:unnamed protein product [Urochloa decumbens]|uniref:F-box protein n=1 Tax=Urochloa decumbens TaxID=240449 RepID=A0ABC8YMS9_9POAL